MPFLKKKPKTAQQKAQSAQMRILLRLACCAYIIFYVIIPLIRDAPEPDSMDPTLKTVVIVAFSAITAAIIVFTIIEFVRNWKAGFYKAAAYTDDEVNAEFGMQNAETENEDGKKGEEDEESG